MENEKETLKKEVDGKHSEINNLNKKLTDMGGELQSLRSDKKALEEQIVNHHIIRTQNILLLLILERIEEAK